jgi:hypothetical protein
MAIDDVRSERLQCLPGRWQKQQQQQQQRRCAVELGMTTCRIDGSVRQINEIWLKIPSSTSAPRENEVL